MTIFVVRVTSNGAPGESVSEEGTGINCGPEITGRGEVGAGDGIVVQAAIKSVAESNTARDIVVLRSGSRESAAVVRTICDAADSLR
jgi:hypothetical protein